MMDNIKYLEVRPVSGHARPVGVLPPAEVLLLIDGHQRVVQLRVNGPHTDGGTSQQRVSSDLNFLARSQELSPSCKWQKRELENVISPFIIRTVKLNVYL